MPAATFDYGTWALLYPDLARCVSEPQGQAFFLQSGLYLDNSECSPVSNLAQRQMLYYLLVAHLAQLNAQAASGNNLVGPIQQAQEGSVSVTVKLPDARGLEFWFLQTPYGAQYWAATGPYRTMQYVAAPQPVFDSLGLVGGWGYPQWPN